MYDFVCGPFCILISVLAYICLLHLMTVTSGLNPQTIPSDLAKNVKILNLDLGNNFIERSSDLKVSTYHCLPMNLS